MKHVYKLIIILPMFFSSNSSSAQNDSSSKKSFFKVNVNYLSDAVYFGRKDSSTVPYLRSSITYNDKSGFYIAAGMALLVSANEPARIDLFNIDAGYDFSINKLDAGIYASRFFYSNASYAVGSELKGLLGVYLGYNLGPVTLNAGGDLLFSTNTDFSTNLGLSHAFESGEENNKWTIAPTAQVNAGTQYFNEAYYEFRKFTIPDYEFSLPVNYDAKRWGLYALPTVAVPTNAASYAIDNAIQKESLSNSFFIEIGAYVKF